MLRSSILLTLVDVIEVWAAAVQSRLTIARSGIGLPKALSKIVAPTVGKSREGARTAQQILIGGIGGVEADDVGHGNGVIVARHDRDGVTSADLALLRYAQIESRPAALQKTF